ncbi:MAG: hypothetical protein MK008_10825 [Bdellovibrionales bacterium]|nr:hypothetical protein [Bdellovibrionales bacterium]
MSKFKIFLIILTTFFCFFGLYFFSKQTENKKPNNKWVDDIRLNIAPSKFDANTKLTLLLGKHNTNINSLEFRIKQLKYDKNNKPQWVTMINWEDWPLPTFHPSPVGTTSFHVDIRHNNFEGIQSFWLGNYFVYEAQNEYKNYKNKIIKSLFRAIISDNNNAFSSVENDIRSTIKELYFIYILLKYDLSLPQSYQIGCPFKCTLTRKKNEIHFLTKEKGFVYNEDNYTFSELNSPVKINLLLYAKWFNNTFRNYTKKFKLKKSQQLPLFISAIVTQSFTFGVAPQGLHTLNSQNANCNTFSLMLAIALNKLNVKYKFISMIQKNGGSHAFIEISDIATPVIIDPASGVAYNGSVDDIIVGKVKTWEMIPDGLNMINLNKEIPIAHKIFESLNLDFKRIRAFHNMNTLKTINNTKTQK